ncbi:hypothetical protein Tco_0919056 [Tanacetum coccineum]
MSSSSSPSHVTVTYTFVSSDDDLPSWGIPLMEAYEPDAPLSPVYAPIYPEYLAPSDDDITPAKDQPLLAPASPTALSPSYIADSEPIKDGPKEDPEMDPVDYPSDEEEEEEPLAPSDSASHIPDSAPSSEETKPFETDKTVATPPPPISPHTTVPLSQTGLRISFPRWTRRFRKGLDLLLHLRGSRLERVQQPLLLDSPGLLWPEDSKEFHTRHQDAQDDRDAKIRVLQSKTRVLQQQRRDDHDMWTRAIRRIQTLKIARDPEHPDELGDASSSC